LALILGWSVLQRIQLRRSSAVRGWSRSCQVRIAGSVMQLRIIESSFEMAIGDGLDFRSSRGFGLGDLGGSRLKPLPDARYFGDAVEDEHYSISCWSVRE
jgi:hypothetical protein